ncbi:GTPase HflX [Candidatus Uhrbacteria bacterium]|nr:GTPase HflX [Candidatus Uhrbacteria bacterium]
MPRIPLKPRAILIDVVPPNIDKRTQERRILELESLAGTYGGVNIVSIIQKRALPDYKTYIGSGKLEEIIALGREKKADVLIINNQLRPGQMYNIEEAIRKAKLPMQAWDRIDLILKIFSKHAKTAEAKLQIKLAAIRHMGPRIYGIGMEMMQQAGGTGTRGGQGETNTELMKRHLFEQEKRIKRDLEKQATSRAGHRARRERLGLKTVSIVGYTNAGKSSLLNALTKKGAYVADALFATLDTRVGKLWMDGREVLLSDTIGFIQDLPPELIDAFRSTLDETVDADLLIHAIDVNDAFIHEKIAEVEKILREIGAHRIPKLYVFTKIDLADRIPMKTLLRRYEDFTPYFVSSHSGSGLEALKQAIADRIANQGKS